MKKVVSFIVFSLVITCSYAQEGMAQQMLAKQDRHYFIENKGQWHSDVLYLARMGGLDAWITKYGVNYTFYKLEEVASPNKREEDLYLPEKFKHKDYTMIGHRVLMQLENHNANPAREGLHRQSGYYNYFIGNDPSKHATNVGLYKEAIVKNVYPGIDLRYYFDKGSLRYDYVVHAGADPSQISFKLAGANKTYMNDNGQLVFETRFGEVAMADLEVYQGGDKKRVEAQFVCKAGERWGFSLGKYDKTQDLVIDPLIYSTYLGGSGNDEVMDIKVDAFHNAYLTGITTSNNYDITPGSFQTIYAGNKDIFITKLNSTGTTLLYSTYLGGNDDDFSNAIAIDSLGNAYIAGYTKGFDYYTSLNAFQMAHEGMEDCIVTKLNATGNTVIYSTFLGGSNNDRFYGIAVDNLGNAYLTGGSNSSDYDVTAGAFQTTYGGGSNDVVVTKLNPTGTALVYSLILVETTLYQKNPIGK